MIKVLKLRTMEEIIAVVEESGDSFIVKKSCYIQTLPPRAAGEAPTYSLVPYASYVVNHEFIIKKDDIVWSADPAQFVLDNYSKYSEQFLALKV